MSFNIFEEITGLIHKTEDLSPEEKSSLNELIQYYKDQNTEYKTFADTFESNEDDMPGLSSNYKDKIAKKLKEFKQHLEDRIHHLEGEYPELTENINRIFTSLSNLGI